MEIKLERGYVYDDTGPYPVTRLVGCTLWNGVECCPCVVAFDNGNVVGYQESDYKRAETRMGRRHAAD